MSVLKSLVIQHASGARMTVTREPSGGVLLHFANSQWLIQQEDAEELLKFLAHTAPARAPLPERSILAPNPSTAA